jgi:hypothetical protein
MWPYFSYHFSITAMIGENLQTPDSLVPYMAAEMLSKMGISSPLAFALS